MLSRTRDGIENGIPCRRSSPESWVLPEVSVRIWLIFISRSKAQSTFRPSIKCSAFLKLPQKLQNTTDDNFSGLVKFIYFFLAVVFINCQWICGMVFEYFYQIPNSLRKETKSQCRQLLFVSREFVFKTVIPFADLPVVFNFLPFMSWLKVSEQKSA